jgi:hypothetical protein
MRAVKRLQIMIEEQLDGELGRQAKLEGVSKAALIRRYVGERLRPLPTPAEDPLRGLVGMIEGGDTDSSSMIDEVVYGLDR